MDQSAVVGRSEYGQKAERALAGYDSCQIGVVTFVPLAGDDQGL